MQDEVTRALEMVQRASVLKRAEEVREDEELIASIERKLEETSENPADIARQILEELGFSEKYIRRALAMDPTTKAHRELVGDHYEGEEIRKTRFEHIVQVYQRELTTLLRIHFSEPIQSHGKVWKNSEGLHGFNYTGEISFTRKLPRSYFLPKRDKLATLDIGTRVHSVEAHIYIPEFTGICRGKIEELSKLFDRHPRYTRHYIIPSDLEPRK